ncbi:NAD(P)/FAD-dependent oxidoreductase [Pusillimonas noertemannii]|uniref:Thioredoxin reductase n=1 Tax=Pusillimonas noertemannii TaxID=305977 RepID=A0A2U1CMN4_9BURK|nr:NAD(P)/FAD-dependent oxidoreductase [Pusillimonas noertemannii]NYT68718.1 NAD(P)/FAD-dependent oxidoreductase [Pusillimonas noertemannii]PVY62263.1 thioredoxin reductase [Pusillimonas noertemannii]TFL10760.1 NAD(P)/FAD-dependent oxidoreductase [Pusillimonas noertemannii]
MHYDVIIIGGSYAGMAAALQLVRARRPVLVIDAGERRNRFASHSHGFLSHDGTDAGEIALNARSQLQTYPALTWLDGRAEAVTGQFDDFTVLTANGQTCQGRRVLFATGVADQLPPVPGIAERWGKTVFHCPYCHGYELGRGRIGVIATGPMSVHQAELLTEWGDVTLLANGTIDIDAQARQTLLARGVFIEEAGIARVHRDADVQLSDGRGLSFAGLFVASRCEPASELAAESGCALEETPIGLQVRTDEAKQTTVPGIFACGDLARAPHSVSFAVADGVMAGIQLHRSLVWPDASA